MGDVAMWNDPIIEEIHAVRRELAAQCNDDLKAIVQRAMQKQQRHAALLLKQVTPVVNQALTGQNAPMLNRLGR